MSLRSRIVDGVFGTLELLAAGYDFVRGLRKRCIVHIVGPRDAERAPPPRPLTRTQTIPRPPRVPRI